MASGPLIAARASVSLSSGPKDQPRIAFAIATGSSKSLHSPTFHVRYRHRGQTLDCLQSSRAIIGIKTIQIDGGWRVTTQNAKGKRAAGGKEWSEISASSYLFVNDLLVPKMRQGAIRQGKSKLIIRIRKSRPNENKENNIKIYTLSDWAAQHHSCRRSQCDTHKHTISLLICHRNDSKFPLSVAPWLRAAASPLVQLFYVFGWWKTLLYRHIDGNLLSISHLPIAFEVLLVPLRSASLTRLMYAHNKWI